jgi:hypothetical protein
MSTRGCHSRKVRYRDKLGALIALSSTQSNGKARRDEVRVYRCPDCRGWHLTSRGSR